MRARSAAPRGVSLVEAIVAMAVMAFGMVAIVGLQATLRLNSDVAKQRSEAVRIAQEAIEDWRAFSSIPTVAGQMAYADIDTLADVTVTDSTTNTTYTLTRTVNEALDGNQKAIRVVVSWIDRNGQVQGVELDSIVARVDPALMGTLSLPPWDGSLRLPQGRNPAIPAGARNMQNGTSAFKPPDAGSAVLWVFDNLSGVIVGVCNTVTTGVAELTGADVQSCIDSTSGSGMPLSGYVRFSTAETQPTAANAEVPTSAALNLTVALALTSTGHPSPDHACYTDAPTSSPTTRTVVRYYCVILFNANATPSWSGTSTLTPLAFLDPATSVPWVIASNAADATATRFRVCRYTPASNDEEVVPNQSHPRTYIDASITEPLTNQNFLVIRAGNGLQAFHCPTDVPADLAAGDLVNSNTLPHQPPP